MLFTLIPEYLHDSELYISLKENWDGIDFDVPVRDYIPPENEIADSIEKYILLFHVYDRLGKYPSNSYLEFENNNKLNIIMYMTKLVDSHTQSKMLIERLLEPYTDLKCEILGSMYVQADDIYLKFHLKNMNIYSSFTFTITIDHWDKYDIDFTSIITSITDKRECFKYMGDESIIETFPDKIVFLPDADYKVEIIYTKYTHRMLIDCFNKINKFFNSYKEIKNMDHDQILHNLNILEAYFPNNLEFTNKIIEAIAT